MSIRGPSLSGNLTPGIDEACFTQSGSQTTETMTRGEFIIGDTKSPPQTIICSERMSAGKSRREDPIMIIVATRTEKIVTSPRCSLIGRLSPQNDQVQIEYQNRKYNILLCGEGTYCLLPGKNMPRLVKVVDSSDYSQDRFFTPLHL